MTVRDDLDTALDETPATKTENEEVPPVESEETEDTDTEETEDTEGDEGGDEGTETDDDSEVDDDEEIEEEAAPTTKEPSRITQLKKDFPEFAKKYPEVIDNYFLAQEYRKVIATVEDAKLAVEKSDMLDGVLNTLDNGRIEEVLDLVHERDPDTLQALVHNFLPTVSQRSPELFKQIINPVVQNLFAKIARTAHQSGNKDLMTAVRIMNRAVFNDDGIPNFVKVEPKRVNDEVIEERERNASVQENNFYDGVKDIVNPALDREILLGLDPDNALPSGLRNATIRATRKAVLKRLRSNQSYMMTVSALKRSAKAANWSREYQKKVSRTIINAAKEIIPVVRPKIKKRMLGDLATGKVRTVKSDVTTTNNEQANTSAGGKSPDKIDWSKTSMREALDRVIPT